MPLLPALSHVNSLILIFLCSNWATSDSPFSKAFSTIITGISSFCQTWLNWTIDFEMITCIQRSYDCTNLFSPGDMNGNDPLMLINILAPKMAKLSENLERFFLRKQYYFFLVKKVLANPQYCTFFLLFSNQSFAKYKSKISTLPQL